MNEMNLTERYLKAKKRLFDEKYKKLNKEQREAVFTTDGSLLVLAGAGSGKTTVLVKRIEFLVSFGNAYYSDYVPYGISEAEVARLEAAASLDESDIDMLLPTFASRPCAPWNILAITFTNKAANEIKTRLADSLGDAEQANTVWAGTFHSICMRILRVYGDRMGYKQGFAVYDSDDSKSVIKGVMKDFNIEEPIKTVASVISRAKDELKTPEMYEREVGSDRRLLKFAKIYAEYQKRLKSSNALDFDDIIMQTVLLLENDTEVREIYSKKFRYVCVDEFQDTNSAQFRLTALLSGYHKNVMVVGDDDQSIYKFRGAVIENILGFDRKFKDTKVIRLERNYRSTKYVLDAANAVISHNVGRKGKTLYTDRQDGRPLSLKLCDDQRYEAEYIAEKIRELVLRGTYNYRDISVLYRINAQSNAIERAFASHGIPHRMYGGQRFNDRKEIKDVAAYLYVIVNPNDRERLKRIINEPKRAIGPKTFEGVLAIADELGMTPVEVMKNASKYIALSRSAARLSAFAEMIEYLRGLLDTDITLEAFINVMLDRSGYRKMLEDGGEDEKERLDNIEEFISTAIEFEKEITEGGGETADAEFAPEYKNPYSILFGFLERNALVADVDKFDEDADAVVMMTIHSAKGLEFPVVFLPGMEDGIFPGMQNITSMNPDDLEEERRLAYVAITRAKSEVYITHARVRSLYNKTSYNPLSRFVEEIPRELIAEDKPKYQTSMSGVKSFFSGRTTETASTVQKKPSGDLSLAEGDRVKHGTFGEGEILSVTKMGSDVLYEVIFDNAGTKKLMGSFARLKKI